RWSRIVKHVRHYAALSECRDNVGAIAYQPDGNIFFLADCVLHNAQGFVESRDQKIAVAGLQAFLYALDVNVNAQKYPTGHGRCQWLGAAHAAHAAGNDQLAVQIAAKMFFARSRKGFKRPLYDSL